MKKLLFLFLLITYASFGQTKYQKDFDEFWTTINDNYAYFDQQDIDWKKVKAIYSPGAATITTNNDFIRFLETVLYELHNGHVSLNTNLPGSNKLIPSGADLYAEKINDKFIITDIRKGFGAELSGLRTGMEIIKFNDDPVRGQLQKFLPKFTNQPTTDMYQFAISMLFAGTHDKPRKITVIENGAEKNYYPDSYPATLSKNILDYKMLDKKTGYIKINNSLGNKDLIAAFDTALDSLMHTKNLVIDLTETPGGGNTTVARAIMGRFINKKLPYQQHEYDELPYDTKRNWVEYVLPRRTTYTGKVIIMVGHWTGSMGEGMAIGFDGMKRATIIGTKMAGLIGAISSFQTSETKIGFQIPTERLYHVNGIPREDFIPGRLTTDIFDTGEQTKKMLKIKSTSEIR